MRESEMYKKLEIVSGRSNAARVKQSHVSVRYRGCSDVGGGLGGA